MVTLCVQTSGVTEEPHTISLKISRLSSERKIVGGPFSCAPGLPEECEHLAAAGINCYRNGLHRRGLYMDIWMYRPGIDQML